MRLKYQGLFATFIASRMSALNVKDVHCIIPIPLHKNRLLKRGFNQSLLIGKALSKLLNIPIIPDLLIRTIDTRSQDGLNQMQRINNLANAFAVRDMCGKYENLTVLLIDDVSTTRSTLEHASCVLQQAGMTVICCVWATA